MKICFHDNSLCFRGTTVALYNWAYWAEKLLGVEPIIMSNAKAANETAVIKKFKCTFNDNVFFYDERSQIDDILMKNNCEYFFMHKGGRVDGIISSCCKNLVSAVAICNTNDIHGDIFATCSKWLSSLTNYQIPYVPYIVDLPKINDDLRLELGIPNNAFVFGRNGGLETFDIEFVKQAIREVIDKRVDIWFVFQYTDKFIDHERVIFLPGSCDVSYKVKFINTCDVMLHAREVGESFGMACGEFSIRNKPIVTWSGSRERSHIDILDKMGIFYHNKNDIINIFSHISKKDIIGKNWNMYQDYRPEKVMQKFKEVYLK